MAEESLEGTLDASFKSIPCTVVSYQDNLGLNDLDPSTVVRSSEVPGPSDKWEDVDLSSLCIFNELPLEPCDNEVMFSRPIGFDETPFFIRPFPIKESDKDIVDKEMRKGCLLGILKKGMSSYSSPIMLIPRKLSGIPRIVTDFRHLNSRLVTLQPSIPLVRDAIQILGASGCEILSLADLRDAYHTLRLSERSKNFVVLHPIMDLTVTYIKD